MRISGNYRFFLIVGYCLLVASIVLPFAMAISGVSPTHGGGRWTFRITFWSFMHTYEVKVEREPVSGSVLQEGTQLLVFSDYWNYWGPGQRTFRPSSILIPMFILQIAGLCLGLVTLLKANRALNILPLFFIMVALNYLYGWCCYAFFGGLYVGFWLSVLVTVFFGIAIIRALDVQILTDRLHSFLGLAHQEK